MWLMTKNGYYSAVEDWNNTKYLLVRARARQDLEILPLKPSERKSITDSPNADYPHRVRIKKTRWAEIVARLAMDIDYGNFKSAVATVDRTRAHAYHEVWEVLHDLETEPRKGRNLWHLGGGASLDDEYRDYDEYWDDAWDSWDEEESFTTP